MTIIQTVEQSEIKLNFIVQYSVLNTKGILHGGELVKHMDNAAGYCASRYAKRSVLTASMDHIEFIEPVELGDLIDAYGRIIMTGRSSMVVEVECIASNYAKRKRKVARGYFTMVAIDDEGKPTEVHSIQYTSDAYEKKINWLKEMREHSKSL